MKVGRLLWKRKKHGEMEKSRRVLRISYGFYCVENQDGSVMAQKWRQIAFSCAYSLLVNSSPKIQYQHFNYLRTVWLVNWYNLISTLPEQSQKKYQSSNQECLQVKGKIEKWQERRK
jgi:uncharacterized membrane protein